MAQLTTGDAIAQAIGLPASTPELDELAETASLWLGKYVTAEAQVDPIPGPVSEAALAVALDILQNRTAAGGENVGYDVTPGPYRMGGQLWNRIAGLVGPWALMGSELG